MNLMDIFWGLMFILLMIVVFWGSYRVMQPIKPVFCWRCGTKLISKSRVTDQYNGFTGKPIIVIELVCNNPKCIDGRFNC